MILDDSAAAHVLAAAIIADTKISSSQELQQDGSVIMANSTRFLGALVIA